MTPWARAMFGDLAERLTEVIPTCLVRAHERARDGHKGVHTQTLEAYGHGLHAVQYEELAAGLEDVPGASAVRLQGRTVLCPALLCCAGLFTPGWDPRSRHGFHCSTRAGGPACARLSASSSGRF